MNHIVEELRNDNLSDYQHIQAINANNPHITVNQMRWLIANKERFEIDHAIKRIGRRLYFHVPSLLAWIQAQKA